MSYKLDRIPGVTPEDVGRLASVGIVSTGSLLARCAQPEGRAAVSESTAITEERLLDWTRRVDLGRISGIGPNTADRLLANGICSVEDLRDQSPDSLAAMLTEGPCPVFRDSQTVGRFARWIAQSQTLRLMLR